MSTDTDTTQTSETPTGLDLQLDPLVAPSGFWDGFWHGVETAAPWVKIFY